MISTSKLNTFAWTLCTAGAPSLGESQPPTFFVLFCRVHPTPTRPARPVTKAVPTAETPTASLRRRKQRQRQADRCLLTLLKANARLQSHHGSAPMEWEMFAKSPKGSKNGQWRNQGKGHWAGGHQSYQYHPTHTAQPPNNTRKCQNQTNKLLKQLISTLGNSSDVVHTSRTQAGQRDIQWICTECSTEHWNLKLSRCRACKAMRPKGQTGPKTTGKANGCNTPAQPTPENASGPKHAPSSVGQSIKFTPLANDEQFINAIEGLGLGQHESDMSVDSGGSLLMPMLWSS